MANKHFEAEIQSRISAFLSELTSLVKQHALEAVNEALGTSGTARKGPGRPRMVTMRPGKSPRAMPTQSRGRRVRRSAEDLAKLQASVFAQVRSKQGQRLEEIGRAMKTDTADLKRPVALLLAAKKLKTKGQKRGTQYFTK